MLTMATRGIGFTLVVTYALPILLLVERSTGECIFEYRRQPPSCAQSTNCEDCTPYMPRTTPDARIIKISFECVVRRQAGVNDLFEIRWFRKNTTGEVEDLGRGDPDMARGADWLSRYHDTKLFNQQYNSSFAGEYWCQVINTTADPDQPLMRSNVFTLLPPENYTGPHCTPQIQAMKNETCADLPMTNQSNQTSKPVPDTTISSTPQAVIIMSTTTHQTTTDTTSIWAGNVASFVPSPSTTPSLMVPSPGQQTLLAVVASVGGVLLIIAIILVVVIAVMLAMKKKTVRQTDQKGGVGIDNNLYAMSDNIYNDVDTPSQDGSHPASAGYHYSVVKKEPQPDVPPTDNYSRLQHEAAQPSAGSTAVYSRLDHTQSTELDVSLAVNGVYSSLEDSNAPLYNSLQTPHTQTPASSGGNEVFDDPNYSNLAGNQLGRTGGGELHPHYTGNYERASDYITPTLRNGQEHSGDHGRDH